MTAWPGHRAVSAASQEAGAALPADVAVPLEVLEDGEIVILAVKPSPYFVLFVSYQVLALSVAVMAATYFASLVVDLTSSSRAVYFLCTVAGFLRLLIGALQWMGRLYVLTNRRVLRIKGVMRPDVAQVLLKNISAVNVLSTAAERSLGLGSLFFATAAPADIETAWLSVARVGELAAAVQDAVNKAQTGNGGSAHQARSQR